MEALISLIVILAATRSAHAADIEPGKQLAALTKLARLGGYLARRGDPPPGNVFIWRGLSRPYRYRTRRRTRSG
jgi:hypothetical protein